MSKITFVGLGKMGLPMAMNIQKANYPIVGVDVSDQCQKSAEKSGLSVAPLNEALKDCTTLITMLPTGNLVGEIIQQAYPILKAGALHLECSTTDIDEAKTMHLLANQHQIKMLDAPVSGGMMGAKNASLTFMVGGQKSVFTQAEKLFQTMGQNTIYCGNAGAGQAAKTCNNMLLAITMIGVSEAFNLADKLALDAQSLFDVSSISSGQCWSLNTYCPAPGPVPTAPSNNQYKPGFSAQLMLKDLNIAQKAAQQDKVHTPLGKKALLLYQAMVEQDMPSQDFSAIIKFLQKNEEEK